MSSQQPTSIPNKESVQQTSAPPKQPLKIRQFQWFQVQTKVRELMGDILQPFTKKQTQQTIKINQLKRNVISIFKRHQEYDFLLEQGDKEKPKYLQLQDLQIEQIQQKVASHELHVQAKLSKMQNTLQIYQQKILQLNNIDAKLDQQVRQRITAFQEFKQGIDEKTQIMIGKIEAQDDSVNGLRVTTRNALNKVEVKMVAQENRIRENQDQHKRKTSEIRKMFDDIVLNNQRTTKLQLKLIDIDERLKIRQKDAKMSQKFFAVVQDVKNDLNFIKSYLQRYQPLYTQLQISQTLNIILKGRNKRLICLYQQQRFARMHEDILNGSKSNLQQRMNEFSNRIRHIINRNKKYIINYKVDRAVRFGQNLYQLRVMEGEQNEDDEEEGKKPLNVIIPETDIKRIVEEKWQELQLGIKNSVQKQIKPTKLWMEQLQQQTIMRSAITDQYITEMKKQTELSQTDFQLFKKHMQVIINENIKRIENFAKINQILMQSVKDVINFGSVINHIVIQDQIDRQGLALYALRGGNQQPDIEKINPTIQLDPKCIACTNNNSSALVNQSFKMACLAYNPSEIKIDQQIFTREEILQVSTNILEKLKNKIDNMSKPVPESSITHQRNKTRNVGPRRSQSQFSKDTKISSVNASKTIDVRSKQMQTLLPVLANSKKSQRGSSFGQRPQHSILY